MEGDNENNIDGEDQNPEMEGGEEGNDEQGEEIDIGNLKGELENDEGEGEAEAEGEPGEEGDVAEGEEVEDDENEEGQELEDSQEVQDSKLEVGDREDEEEQAEGDGKKDERSHATSSKGFGVQSDEGEEHSGEGGDDLGESNEDDGEDEGLPPERKIRYRLFKFINKMRTDCHMTPYHIDLIANNLAMLYADYLLNNKENEEELNNMAKALNFKAEFKVSSLDSFIDSDGGRPDINAMAKYMEFEMIFTMFKPLW